jgi:GH25 family lysozyme M1 (1,4-beta-N-acetylmuramidase)
MERKGIDVSTYQGDIDWDKVKRAGIEFAIIRCGFGSDIASQDDNKFSRNVEGAKRVGIPYGVYLYSYADTDEKLQSEIKHVLRLIKGLNPFCVYFDMEDDSTIKLGKPKLTQYGLTFCKAIKDAGYVAGIYANQNWCRNYLDIKKFEDDGYSIWCAKFAESKPSINASFDIWQHTSKGRVDGINGNVDQDIMYKDLLPATPAPAPAPAPATKLNAEQLATNIIRGDYGNGADRINKLKSLGYSIAEINAAQAVVNNRLSRTTRPSRLNTNELATEIIKGTFGNGSARVQNLLRLGYPMSQIKAAQAEVNRRLK